MNIVHLVILALISVTCAVPVTNNKPPIDVIVKPRGNVASVVSVVIVDVTLVGVRVCAAALSRDRTRIDQEQARCDFVNAMRGLENESPKASADGSLHADHTFRYKFFLAKDQQETQDAYDYRRAQHAIDLAFRKFSPSHGPQFEVHEQLEGRKLSATDDLNIFGVHINTEFSIEIPESKKLPKFVVKGPCNLWFSFRENDELWVGWAQQEDRKLILETFA
ncbi:hypothetical protein EV361DRAFT_978748 [Lentinula raphanica]|nr:hypothetical protein EV361DRAFT_978748 [Lentinula raphanica]